MEDTVTVVARITARMDTAERLQATLADLVDPTRGEKGCVSYTLFKNNADPTEFVFIEQWQGDASIDAHMASPHVQAALERAGSLLAKAPEIQRYSPLR